MKKLLFTILAFGIMTSVSFAETKTAWVDGTLRNPITQKVIEINDYMRIYKHEVNLASCTLDAGDRRRSGSSPTKELYGAEGVDQGYYGLPH